MPLLRKILTVAINILVLLLMLIPIELALRFFHLGYSNAPVDADHVVNWKHPVDYRYTMFTPSGEFGGFPVYFDSLGRRNQLPEKAKHRDASDSTIVFLGDSFVEALQVPYDSSFVGILSNRFPKVSFLDYGVTGYGAVLYYLQCRRMLEEHHVQPSAVFMVLYSNDVRDDSAFLDRAVYRPGDHEIVAIDGGKRNTLLPLLRQSYLARTINKMYLQWKFSREVARNYKTIAMVNGYAEESPSLENSLTASYILKTDSLLQQHHIPFYITVVPSKYSNYTGHSPDHLFATKAAVWSRQHQLSFIDLQTPFREASQKNHERFFYAADVHYNAAGHRLTADVLAATIERMSFVK